MINSDLSGVLLKDVYPQIVVKLTDHLSNQDIIDQLNDVLVVSQALNGTPEKFSFMAYPVPRLTFEQRQLIAFQETKSISFNISDSSIKIDLDNFGKINWFHVNNLPEMYFALQNALR